MPAKPAPTQVAAARAAPLPTAQSLRQRAEARLQDSAGVDEPAEHHHQMTRTLHELRVHEIELEMQNQELRSVQLALEKSRASYADLYHHAPVGYLTLDTQGKILQVNQIAASLLGQACQALVGQAFSQFIWRDDQDSFYLLRKTLQATAAAQPLALRLLRHEAAFFWAELQATCMPDETDTPVFRIVLSDITERQAMLKKLQLAASVFENAREGIMITDTHGNIVEVNDAFSRITGFDPTEVLGHNPRMLSSGHHSRDFYAAMWGDLIAKGHWYGEVWNRRKNGDIYTEMQTVTTLRDSAGQTTHYVALFSDITNFKAHQTQLQHIAHYDLLTDLPNRALLADRLRLCMAQTVRRGNLLGVVFLDLDNFKAVNDSHGHSVGDLLLQTLAVRMKEALRDGDTLARIGGDEFVAVLTDLDDTTASLPLLERLLGAASQPAQVAGLVLQVSASLGITFFPQSDSTEPDQLLRQADQAMYQAKQSGKNRYHLFDAVQDRQLRGHHDSINRIRLALLQHELVLYYQPKVNLRTGLVIGAEALIRWQHPQKGLLAPAEFLPLIEEHALAIEVDEWVLNTALTQMTRWQQHGLALPVSVNVGALQLQQSNFVERLRAILAGHPQVSARSLQIEMLETSALKDLRYAAQVIEDCRQMGVAFALDDFGTGYSSLTYLKQLRVAMLKIDQSFVRNMLSDPDDQSILQGIIGLAAAFHREVIAEGVETIAHGTLLLQLGCELAQGYGIARPMPAADLPAWAASWQPDAAWRSGAGSVD